MVQAWYQGGISVWDFTDSAKPEGDRLLGARARCRDARSSIGGSWSAYYYNGHIYSNDIQKGLDVLEVRHKAVKKAKKVRMDVFNAQSQPSYNG